jgi:hypothetical protein
MALRTRTVQTSAVVGGDAKIEEYLDKKGVTWVFHPRMEPDQFDAAKSLHNQARIATPLDDKRVDQYAEAMRRGEEFPPVIAHGKPGKYVIADGNHRLQASIRSKKPIPMYHITGDARTIVLITFEANTRHGLPTSEDDRIQHALYLLENGANIPEAAAALNLSRKVVEKASQQRNADLRFKQANLKPMIVDKLTEPVKRRLKDISTDEGFVAAVHLTVDAALVSGEVFNLVTEINELRSSTKQVEYVKALRDNLYKDRIQGSGGGTFTRKGMGPKQRLNLAISNMNGVDWEDIETVAKAYVGPEREEAAERLQQTAQRLQDLAKVLTS